MNTLLIFIIVTIAFIIGKFIYDSYLTNNTNRRWAEFKSNNPEVVYKVERSKLGAKKNKAPVTNNLELHLKKSIKERLTRKILLEEKETFDDTGVKFRLFDIIDIASKEAESIKTELIRRQSELKLSTEEINKIIDQAINEVSIAKAGFDKLTMSLDNSQNSKQNLTFQQAREILKKRPILKEGINENIRVYKIEPLALDNDFIQIKDIVGEENLDDYLVTFDATNQEALLRAIDYFEQEDYERAVNQRVTDVVQGYIAKQIQEYDYINVEGVIDGLTENGKPNIVVGNLFPPSN
jgi:hypothetical protein